MNLNVYLILMTYNLMSLGNVAGIICNWGNLMCWSSEFFANGAKRPQPIPVTPASPPFGQSETRIQQQQPTAETPEFIKYSEGAEANTDCEDPELDHQWYHRYQNSNEELYNIPLVTEVKITRYRMNVENFDNNTEIFCFGLRKELHNESLKTRIQVDATENPEKMELLPILTYAETKKVHFKCPEYVNEVNKTSYPQVGVIDTTSNILKTYWNPLNRTFNISHNKTILCCVYHVVTGTSEKWITRHIANKTLLVYSFWQEAIKDMISSNGGGTYPDIDPSNWSTYIILAAVGAVVLILLVMGTIVMCKKRFRRKPKSDTKVLYADLDFLRQTDTGPAQRQGPEEESPYAQIIGELRPENN